MVTQTVSLLHGGRRWRKPRLSGRTPGKNVGCCICFAPIADRTARRHLIASRPKIRSVALRQSVTSRALSRGSAKAERQQRDYRQASLRQERSGLLRTLLTIWRAALNRDGRKQRSPKASASSLAGAWSVCQAISRVLRILKTGRGENGTALLDGGHRTRQRDVLSL